VTPNIVAFVPVKTVSFANILRSRRSTRIGVYCLMPRVYMTPICRGWSREYCSSDQCRRSKFQPGHFQLLHLTREPMALGSLMEMVRRLDR
jgi:hypothetical protein